jgi:hypothetical protein
VPGRCKATDRPCCEGEPCHESPQNRCEGHDCDDYQGYPVEDDRSIGWDEPSESEVSDD